MSFTVNWEKNGVVTTFSGIVDAQEVMQADREFYRDPRSDNARYQITDFSRAEPGLVREFDIEAIAGFDLGSSLSIPNLKVALVTTDPQVVSWCEQYIYLSRKCNSSWEFAILNSINDAREWLSE